LEMATGLRLGHLMGPHGLVRERDCKGDGRWTGWVWEPNWAVNRAHGTGKRGEKETGWRWSWMMGCTRTEAHSRGEV